jgi:hypothetical protein
MTTVEGLPGDGEQRLYVLGVDSDTNDVIAAPQSVAEIAKAIAAVRPEPDEVPSVDLPPTFGLTEDDPYDPLVVGWQVIVGTGDPDKQAIIDALRPLAERRGCPSNWMPLEYNAGRSMQAWIDAVYNTLDDPPRFLLLAGSPTHLPFTLQVALATFAYVGRLDFATVNGGTEVQHPELFATYTDKVLRNERGEVPATDRSVVVWATAGGFRDPTRFSRNLMAGPLADRIEQKGKFAVTRLFDGDATAGKLTTTLTEARPRLVFTASHGDAVAASKGVDQQAALNGALVGQDAMRFRATDLPGPSEAFVEGGIVFSFACFGYGTPARSGYTHWWPSIAPYQAPFELVSALPKAAIAHPRGPLGYIGHADYAVLHAFTEASRPGSDGLGPLAPRLMTFRDTLDEALLDRPVGAVIEPFASRLSLLNLQLTQIWDDAKAAGADMPSSGSDLVDMFLRRNDARYYLVLGDPAARPRSRTKEVDQ